MRGNEEGALNAVRTDVLIVDPNADTAHGHHAHWSLRLSACLDSHGLVCRTVSEHSSHSRSPRHWYSNAIDRVCADAASDVIFTSGDDAIVAALLRARHLRFSQKTFHFFMFRLAPQPRLGGIAVVCLKVFAALLLRLIVGRVEIYSLEMPFEPRPTWRRWFRFRSVIDSSALETSSPVGKGEASASLTELLSPELRFILVIGVLGRGKHVDTILDAWRMCSLDDTALVFAGEADSETEALIESAMDVPGVVYLPGRLSDEVFDRLIEAAEVVLTLYRYSASSGVVLKALRLGTKVLAGGSKVLTRQLHRVAQVVLLRRVTPRTVADGITLSLSLKDASPMKFDDSSRAEFPFPIVDVILGQKT